LASVKITDDNQFPWGKRISHIHWENEWNPVKKNAIRRKLHFFIFCVCRFTHKCTAEMKGIKIDFYYIDGNYNEKIQKNQVAYLRSSIKFKYQE